MDAMRVFSDEAACEAYIGSIKWPDGPTCSRCRSTDVGFIKSRRRYQCRSCRRQFSLKTQTVFESSPLTLAQWIVATWMIANHRNGVSSCEIARALGIKQQSAWHLCHRVRNLARPGWVDRLQGEVESDSTLVGGRFKFMHKSKRDEAAKRGPHGKSVVHALLERGGEVRAMVIKRESSNIVMDICKAHIAYGSKLYTDSANEYRRAGEVFKHEFVNHMMQYVRGSCHTNGLENFFSLLRRSIKGTYVAVDPQHLTAYVDEQAFRFNNRKETDWQRFDRLMRKIVGRRLMYSTLTRGKTR